MKRFLLFTLALSLLDEFYVCILISPVCEIKYFYVFSFTDTLIVYLECLLELLVYAILAEAYSEERSLYEC